ncbi:DUF2695 domain-containing protein [Marinigracilibium pacificum]|nr:DUF2695 domain-containing protein [Marinigracilibium pacificum]
MKKNKEHRDKIKSWKKQQEQEFLESLPFPERIFQELFNFLDSTLEIRPCQHDFRLTSEFLSKKGIRLEEHIDFLIDHGGGCDCEVLMNVEDAFPHKEFDKNHKPAKPPKREKINSLEYEDLILTQIPSPWKLYKAEDQYEFQFGMNQDIKIELLKDFPITNWEDESYWRELWELKTELKVQGESEVVYEELGDLELVTFKTKGWIPVLTWIRRKETSSWGLVFRTELSRLRGDMNELKNLLRKIK